MSRPQWGPRLFVVVAAIAAPGMAVIAGASPDIAARVGLAVVLAVVVETTVQLAGAALPRARQSEFAVAAGASERPPVAPPSRLAGWQRAMEHGAGTSGGWHFRARPVLRELADGVLDDRHGVRLDQDLDRARALLGGPAWDRLRPDVADPEDRWAPGLSMEELDAVVRRIEELRWG